MVRLVEMFGFIGIAVVAIIAFPTILIGLSQSLHPRSTWFPRSLFPQQLRYHFPASRCDLCRKWKVSSCGSAVNESNKSTLTQRDLKKMPTIMRTTFPNGFDLILIGVFSWVFIWRKGRTGSCKSSAPNKWQLINWNTDKLVYLCRYVCNLTALMFAYLLIL